MTGEGRQKRRRGRNSRADFRLPLRGERREGEKFKEREEKEGEKKGERRDKFKG